MRSRLAALTMICLFIFIEVNYTQLSRTQIGTELMNSLSQDQSASRGYEYRELKSGKGITKDGIEASFQTYESSDGTKVFTRIEFFRSASEMETQFETKTKSFSDIIERSYIEGGSVKGIKSDIIEERIVGRHYPDEEGKEKYSIIWNRDNKISYIESTSLNHILDFEKKFYKSEK